MKKQKAIINSIALNLTSQYKFIKNAATKNAFTTAIDIAVIMSKGAGMTTNFAKTTVRMVKINNAIPTAQSWPAVEI